MGERAVAFANIHNFRDLGGYRGLGGRTIRWQRLYRSDDLSRVREADQTTFAGLGVRTVIDLRRPNEVAAIGRIPAFDGYAYHHVHLDYPAWASRTFTNTAERTDYVIDRYLEMADSATEGIGDALRLIADKDNAPLVFHCIAGKDRTGVVAALTLSLLGISDDDIADDYHLSEAAEEPNWAWHSRNYPDLVRERLTHLTISPREGMLGFLDQLRSRHGSVEAYVASLGVTDAHVAAMREHLLTS
jgi:protein-tyrosine phosphatase